jgi:thiol-disulfide isomerase/thioredoxin
VHARLTFAGIGAIAALAGAAAWWATRVPREPLVPTSSISAGAIWSASFKDTRGASHSLGEFQGQVVVINFWATWCAPCREEMPGFVGLQDRWKGRGVQFVGLSDEDPAKVERFAAELKINYPLWVGTDTAGELSRRLGNRLGVLPHTVILDPAGNQIDMRVGPYTERDLEPKLAVLAPK